MISAREKIVGEVRRLLATRTAPMLVAFDGPSGSGKSTLAQMVAVELSAAIVQGDYFFTADIPDVDWDSLTAAEKVRDVIDWRRLRKESLSPLLAGHDARWRAFDFAARHPDGTYPLQTDFTEVRASGIIILDGTYSTQPGLADLIDLSVFVYAPRDVRHRHLATRETTDFLRAWHAHWDEAEEFCFSHMRPKSSFDLLISIR